MITLGSLQLPDGLVWDNEFDWTAPTTSITYSLTGSLIVHTANKLTGQPISLKGDVNFTWVTRAQLIAIKATLDACPSTGLMLTLHDSRTFTVVPMPLSSRNELVNSSSSSTAGALTAIPIPVVLNSPLANPTDDSLYVLQELRLVII